MPLPPAIASVRRFTGLAGLAFALLSAVIAIVPPWPPSGAAAAAVLAYYGEHRLPFLIGNYAAGLASLPGLAQIAGVAWLLRKDEDNLRWSWLAVAIAGAAAHAAGLAILAVFQALAIVAVPGNEQAALALSELGNWGLLYVLVPMVVTGAAFALALPRSRLVPAWVGHSAWVPAGLGLLPSLGGLGASGFFAPGAGATLVAYVATFAWTGLFSVVLLRRAP